MALRRGVSADTPHVSSCHVYPGEGSCCRGASTVPGLCHQSKPLPTQFWWSDSVQGCRGPDHILLGAGSHSRVVVRAKR
jgi:hypothetical protein